MRSKFIFSWALLFDAFRSAGVLMMLQGVMCLLFFHTDQLMAWGRGSVLIGLLFWAAWAISKQLGVGKDRDMHDASF
jgi:Na+/phosphate symporter